MRTLSAAAQTEFAKQYGVNPVTIVEIEWVAGGGRTAYADRDINDRIKGRILELTALDSVIDVSGGSDSQEISLRLDDTDGSIKAIFDAHDVHKRRVWVYQWAEGLDLSERFLLFSGRINSPIEWDERDRTFAFSVVNQLEDTEIGFSPEEGQFSQIPDEMIGRPWPMAFGTVLDLPALNVTRTVTGTTQQGVGIVSGADLHGGIYTKNDANRAQVGAAVAVMNEQISALNIAADRWARAAFPPGPGSDRAEATARQMRDQRNEISQQRTKAVQSLSTAGASTIGTLQSDVERFNGEETIGPSIIRILGGEDFPQGVPVEVEIGSGGLFTGIFDCQEFRILNRRHADNEARAQEEFDKVAIGSNTQEGPGGSFFISVQGPDGPVVRKGFIVPQTIVNRRRPEQVAQHYWADAGSQVRLAGDQEQWAVVSIVPGTVLAVKAYKRFEGVRRLVNVPTDLWEQVDRSFGSVSAVFVKLSKQLSSIADQNWEDDLYITFQSDVGPNTVDILEYLIDAYSGLTADTTTFDAVRTKLDAFPSNFAIFDRPQILDILKDIAFQARCGLFVKDETVYLTYLPEEPASVATITESGVDHTTLGVSLTGTEELVTKMVVKWRPTYAEDSDRTLILRHNVEKYGVQEQEFEFFIYNQPEIVRHAATFWLIRKSNTWKRLRCTVSPDFVKLETFDAVTLDLAGNPVSNGTIKALVEAANYDTERHEIALEVWVPVKAGQMSQYQFAWPASADGTFPAAGDSAGGGNVGQGATGDLPVGALSLDGDCDTGGGIIVGGPNIVWVGPADLGTPKPQDIGFAAQPVIFPGTDFELIVSPNPNPDLSITYEPEVPVPPIPQLVSDFAINVDTTPIVKSERSGTLATLLRDVNEAGELVLDTNARFGDGAQEASFDFRHDEDGGKFGAGTAFLKD